MNPDHKEELFKVSNTFIHHLDCSNMADQSIESDSDDEIIIVEYVGEKILWSSKTDGNRETGTIESSLSVEEEAEREESVQLSEQTPKQRDVAKTAFIYGTKSYNMDKSEDSEERSKEEPEAAGGAATPENVETTSEEREGRDEAPGEEMEVDWGSGESASVKNGDNMTQSSEKQKANDTAFDSLFQDYSKEPSKFSKVTDTTDDAPETAEMENQKPNEAKKMSSPILKMSFVDESVSTEKEKNSDMLGNGVDDKGDSDKMETESAVQKKEESKTSDEDLDKERNKQSLEHKDKDENSEEKKGSDETDKPTLKLASFSTMSTSTENGHSEENEDGCYSCSKLIPNLYEAIVWETMQFCDEVTDTF